MRHILPIVLAGLVGLISMLGGLVLGIFLAPLPKLPPRPPVPVAVHPEPAIPSHKKVVMPSNPLDPEAVRQTYDALSEMDENLEAKARDLEARENHVKEKEEEISREKEVLAKSHQHLAQLFTEFQNRLLLVENNQMSQIQRQVTLYGSMDVSESVDMIRAQDDASVSKLFALMEDKQLSQTLSGWKKQYPDDIPRLLSLIDGMSRVFPKDKMAPPDLGTAPGSEQASSSSPPPSTSPPTDSSGPNQPGSSPTDANNPTASSPQESPPASSPSSAANP